MAATAVTPAAGPSVATTPGPLSFRPSTDLWYHDGTIVLVAGAQGFRVYSGILAQQSPVFADMLAIPQPDTHIQATHEGCPLVYLLDNEEEVACLLRALFDARYNIDRNLSFTDLAHLLRSSNKYAIQHIRQRTVNALRYSFPSTLVQRDSILLQEDKTKVTCAQLFDLANACREVLVMCSQIPLHTIVQSIGRIGSGCLNPENLRVVLEGRDHLTRLATSVVLAWLFLEQNSCNKTCLAAQKKAIGGLLHGRDDVTDTFMDPLRPFGDYEPLSKSSMCLICIHSLKNRIIAGRVEVWSKLPEIYGFKTWITLEEEVTDDQ